MYQLAGEGRPGRLVQDSVYYWAQKNNIPVYCPALTDGSLGDMLYFFSYSHSPGLSIDIVADIRHAWVPRIPPPPPPHAHNHVSLLQALRLGLTPAACPALHTMLVSDAGTASSCSLTARTGQQQV